MPSLSSYILASAGASLVNAQFGNFGSPYPNTTYPGFESENPYTIEGSQSFQWSPPKYPSPWGEGSGDWKESYAKARALVSQLTLEEKVNLTSGVGTSKFSFRLELDSMLTFFRPGQLRWSDWFCSSPWDQWSMLAGLAGRRSTHGWQQCLPCWR